MMKRSKEPSDYSQTCNRILEGTTIEGEINSKGDFRVDGVLKGTIIISGKLVVGKKGHVEGDIQAGSATVSGYVTGTMHVAELLALQASAKVHCDVTTNKLSVEPGAEFTGSCSMGAIVREMQKDDDGTSEGSRKQTANGAVY